MPSWFYAGTAVLAALGALVCILITIDVLTDDNMHPLSFIVPAALAAGLIYATCYLGAQI